MYSKEQFKELTNLRFLQVNGVNLAGDFWNLLPQLRWLWWERCPSDFAATNFHLEKLVVLDLSWSTISEDWGGWALLKVRCREGIRLKINCMLLKVQEHQVLISFIWKVIIPFQRLRISYE